MMPDSDHNRSNSDDDTVTQTDNSNEQLGLSEFRRRLVSLPTLAGLLLGLLILALLLQRFLDFEWDEFASNLSLLNLRLYALAALCYYLSFWFRGIRWQSIARTAIAKPGAADQRIPGVITLAGLILAGWFLNSVMFLRLGDAYRGWALAARTRLNFGGGFGTVFVERIQDMGIVLVLVIIAGVWALMVDGFAASGPLVDAAVGIAVVASALVGILVVLLITMGTFGERIARLVPGRFQSHYLEFQSATLENVKGPRVIWQFVFGVLGWVCEVARFYFVAQALGLDMALSIAMFAALANAILSTAPIPGGFGLVETGLIGILLLTGVSDTDAFTLTVLDRAISWVGIVVLGSIPFVYFAVKRPEAEDAIAQPNDAPAGESGDDEKWRP